MWFSFFMLAAALSMDAFGIGAAYTLKGVSIPGRAKMQIGFLSAVILWGASCIGKTLSVVLPAWCLKYFGIVLLIGMGLACIKNSRKSESGTYDLDESKKIEGIETLLLAAAISVDSVSIGIAAAALGYSWFLLGLAAGFVQMLFLIAGEAAVKHSRLKNAGGRTGGVLSGGMLIVIGIIRLFTS